MSPIDKHWPSLRLGKKAIYHHTHHSLSYKIDFNPPENEGHMMPHIHYTSTCLLFYERGIIYLNLFDNSFK